MELIEGVNARYCTKCGELKAFTEFHKNAKGKYGVCSRCKKCLNTDERNRRSNIKESEIKDGMKRCSKCGELKPFTEFYKKKTGKYGLHAKCKECVRAEEYSRRKQKKEHTNIDYSQEYINKYTSKNINCQKTNIEDLTGQKFGRLTAIEPAYKEKGVYYWKCKCDCGNEVYVRKYLLLNGSTRSCGCLSKELKKERFDKQPLCEKDAYKGTRIGTLTSKTRFNSKSGVKGVSFHKATQKWRARITIQGKVIYLGTFTNKEDAIKARKEAEEIYFKPIIEEYKQNKKLE